MRKIDLENMDEVDFIEATEEYSGFCDVKATPEDVLEEVDKLLDDFGLEVVIADGAGGTDTLFTIVKKRKGAKRNG